MTGSDVTADVMIEDAGWHDLERLATIAVPAALRGAGVSGAREVVILGCDDARIAKLNAEFRAKAVATNVLSWPSAARDPDRVPEEAELGDIAIAFQTCEREAIAQCKAFDVHVIHLIVHATLHLLGHDHVEEAEAARMEALESRIMAGLGFPDPYLSDISVSVGVDAGQGWRPAGSDGQ